MPVSKEVQYLIDKHGLQGGNFVESNPNYTVFKQVKPKQDFASNVASSVKGVAQFAGKALYGAASGFGVGVGAWGHNILGGLKSVKSGMDMNTQVASAKKLLADYKSGKISAARYTKEYERIMSANVKSKAEGEKAKKDQLSTLELAKASVKTAENVAALVLSGGLGKAGLESLAAKEGAVGAAGKALNFGARSLGLDTSANVGTALAKSQLVAKPSIETLPQIAKDVSSGNYGSAAVNTGLLAAGGIKGGPLEAAGSVLSKTGSVANKALYDTHGLYDVIKLKGGKTINQNLDALAKTDPKAFKKITADAKVLQDLAHQEHGTNPNALKLFLEANQPAGRQFKDMTLAEWAKQQNQLLTTRSKFQKIAEKAGLKVPEGKGVIAGRLTQGEQKALADRLGSAASPQKELAAIKAEGLINNSNLSGQLDDMVRSGATGKELAERVGQLDAITPALVGGKEVRRGGYVLGLADNAGTVRRASEVGDIVKGKKAPLGFIGRTLEGAGLSTKESSPELQRALFKKVSTTFKNAVDNSNIKLSGQDALTKLSEIAQQKHGVTDIRQLNWREVSKELAKFGVKEQEAKDLLKTYKSSFGALKLSERGLAGKVTDLNLKLNPVAAPYSRIQSIARYEANPFFRVQENLETKIGTKMFTGSVARPGKDYSSTIEALDKGGFFKNAGFGGVGADEFGGITAKLSRPQMKDLAAGIEAIGGTSKSKVAELLADPKNTELLQNLKAVVQYPDKGFTSSNFMKAMNLAIFPTRYNAKVTMLAAKALSKQPGAMQVQVLKGLNDFNNWTKTPEGTKWKSKNSEAIGIIKYLTPIGSIESTLKLLGGDFKDMGTIGGLPFGIISQVLSGQGVRIAPSTPYLDPKTGEVVPEKIPADQKAQAKQAVADIINTLFTYPGRQVGLLSKGEATDFLAKAATGGKLEGGKFAPVTRTDLTPSQKRTQAVLQAGNSQGKYKLPSKESVKTVPMSSPKYDFSRAGAVNSARFPKSSFGKVRKAKARATAPGAFRP